jgi:hypothetical protein
MLIITKDPSRYENQEALGNTVVWAKNFNTMAAWVLAKDPDCGYTHFKTLEGTAIGKECMILGYGPSRKRFKELGYKGTVFALNRAVDEAPDADYWCAHELDVIKSHAHYRAKGSTLVTQGAHAVNREFGPAVEGLKIVMIDAAGDPLRWPKERRPLYWNEITFGWVLHLAVRMGFQRIYTLGVDLSLGGYAHPAMDNAELERQHYGVQCRTIEMFNDPVEKRKWYEREVEILDLSCGNLPVTKVHGILISKAGGLGSKTEGCPP